MAVRWRNEALEDIEDILRFLQEHGADKARTTEVNRAIVTKARWISTRPSIGNPIEDTPYRVTYAVDFRYGIYYRELSKATIRVLAVKHTSQERPTVEELISRDI